MANQNKGFFEKLFDFSFSSFVAPQVVGVLYILGLVVAALVTLGTIFSSLTVLRFNFLVGIGSLIASVLGLFAYAIGLRVFLESIIAQIRTAESTRILAEDVLNRTANPNLNS